MKRFMKKRFGFTLAEVLITLGIIGVVAAMTIPTLIQNTNSSRWSSQYKKTISTLSNAIEMAQAHHGVTISGLNAPCTAAEAGTIRLDSLNAAGTAPHNHAFSICGLINSTLSNVQYVGTFARAYRNATDRGNISNATGITAEDTIVYRLADGSLLGINRTLGDGRVCRLADLGDDPGQLPVQCHGFIDTNGTTPPNAGLECNGDTVDPNTARATGCANVTSPDISDIFPIVFFDDSVTPSSSAAALLLTQQR